MEKESESEQMSTSCGYILRVKSRIQSSSPLLLLFFRNELVLNFFNIDHRLE